MTKAPWKMTCPLVTPAFYSLTLRLRYRQSGVHFKVRCSLKANTKEKILAHENNFQSVAA